MWGKQAQGSSPTARGGITGVGVTRDVELSWSEGPQKTEWLYGCCHPWSHRMADGVTPISE